VTSLRPTSLRAGAVLSACVAVLLGTILMGVVALITVTGAVNRSLDEALSVSAGGVVAQLKANPPSSDDDIQLPPIDAHDPVVVQVVDAAGTPIATTPGVSRSARICADAAAAPGRVTQVDFTYPGLTGTFRVLATPTVVEGRALLVCTAGSDRLVETTRRTVVVVLAIAIPVITALVGLLVARQVGRALGAVSELTREADRVRTLDEGRLGVPASGDEVADLAVTLNTLLDRLHEQSQATRQFVADAGHELRTPLASLRVALDLSRDNAPDDDPWADEAITDVERLSSLVDDLLVLARVDSGAPQRVELLHVPEAVADEVALTARLREGVTVRATGSVDVVADRRGLRRAVRNLLANAVRHAETRVELRCTSADGWVVVEVVDDGPGIPADQVERVFERFVRLDESRGRDSGGSGLGLAIVAAFANQSGGHAVATPGPGGRVVLRLPVAGQDGPAASD
jgi:signal transduction histidine kinase